MFLADKFRTVANEERGAALLAAIGLTAVAAIITVTVTSSSLYAVGYSTSMRSGVQAQAAAEAGIDFAAASLGTTTAICQSQYSSATEPVFTVAVFSSTLASSPGDVDSSWVSGCPTTTSVKRLKLVSTGTANSSGVAGNSSGNSRKVEAIYPYIPTPPTWITATGATIYSFNQTDSTVNNLTITQAGAAVPTIQYLSGSVQCTSGSVIYGNVILGNGGASLASGCTINGDLYASGTINLQSATVTGNVSAANGTYPSVSLSNSATVKGTVYGAGPVSLQGAIGGNVIAGPIAGASDFSSQATIGGSVVVAGTVVNKGTVKGTITQNQTGIVTPTVPFVPGWVDYPYAAVDWPGFTELALTDCSKTSLSGAMTTVLASSTPRILNLLGCSTSPDFSKLSSTLTLTSDLVIVSNSFAIGNDFESSNTTDKHLWLTIPDRGVGGNMIANSLPDCPSGGNFTMSNSTKIGTHVDALIYSPCAITNSANTWQGQIYAASTKTDNAFTVNYAPLGLPTVSLTTGLPTMLTPPGTGVLGARTSIRTLNVG